MSDEWNVKEPIRFDLKASNEIHSKREEICKSCDQLNKLYLCKQCGCFMPVKTWLKSSECPLKKW